MPEIFSLVIFMTVVLESCITEVQETHPLGRK